MRAVALVLAIQLVSVADEIAIGKQAQAEVRRQTPELDDATVNAFVARVGRRLAAHARGARYPYSFSVANYREINAFALPGGPVWVNRGAIQSAGNEAQFCCSFSRVAFSVSKQAFSRFSDSDFATARAAPRQLVVTSRLGTPSATLAS